MLALIAQSSPAAATSEILRSLAIIAVLAVVLVLVGVLVYRAVQRRIETSDVPFTLGQLRRMHEEGKISDEEFERMKSAMIGRAMEGGDTPRPRPASTSTGDAEADGNAEDDSSDNGDDAPAS
ncbi:MAG: hypothetical protein CMJ18_23810 [Phycisphaeraceae bacterium]|nr:hypothetical protein [Phycisphaeraceae bacterium]